MRVQNERVLAFLDTLNGKHPAVCDVIAANLEHRSLMQSRTLHALGACTIFFGIAQLYGSMAGRALDSGRVLFWSVAGVGVYILLCGLFGFDPHRTRLAAVATPLMHYIDRWELRLGQATLAMLGCIVVTARIVDPQNFVTAVVCATLSAWTYFVLRLSRGGYRTARDQ